MGTTVLTEKNTPKADTKRSNPISFVGGQDDFLVNREGDTLARSFIDDEETEVEIINGYVQNSGEAESAINQFIQALQSPSLFNQKKLVWLKNISFIADSVVGRATSTKESVDRLIEQLPHLCTANNAALLTASPVDRRTKQFKTLQQLGNFIFIESDPKGNSLHDLANQEAKDMGITFAAGALDVLLGKINNDTRLLIQEIRKLATYSPNTEIKETLIHELVPQFGESDFFETSEAFYSKDLTWALAALERHFFSGKDARPLLTSLQNRNRLLIQLKVLAESGEMGANPRSLDKNTLERAARAFELSAEGLSNKHSFNVFSQNPWYLGKLLQTAQQFTLKQLMEFQADFIEVFEKILANPNGQQEILSSLFYKAFIKK